MEPVIKGNTIAAWSFRGYAAGRAKSPANGIREEKRAAAAGAYRVSCGEQHTVMLWPRVTPNPAWKCAAGHTHIPRAIGGGLACNSPPRAHFPSG